MWSLARMARYVKKTRYLQQLKENNELYDQSLEKGSYLLFCKNKPYLDKKESGNPFQNVINWKTFQEVEPFHTNLRSSSIVLDVVEDDKLTPLFVCDVSPEQEVDITQKYGGFFVDMRRSFYSLSEEQHQHVSRGYAMVTWNAEVNFCSYCGSPLERRFSGCSKVCSGTCSGAHATLYPRIHPVAITRILNHSQDKILLVRGPHHPKGMYSCIAGFMEPGEVLHDNIRREIAEEAGIVVDNVEYFKSEAWPLPQTTLMLACTAIAMPGSDNITMDESELEDAKWFTKDEAAAAFARVTKNPKILSDNPNRDFIIPPKGAVAYDLIANWLEKYTPKQL